MCEREREKDCQGSEDLEGGECFLSLAVEHLATSGHTRNWSLRAVRSRTGNIMLAAMTSLPSIVCSLFVAGHIKGRKKSKMMKLLLHVIFVIKITFKGVINAYIIIYREH